MRDTDSGTGRGAERDTSSLSSPPHYPLSVGQGGVGRERDTDSGTGGGRGTLTGESGEGH